MLKEPNLLINIAYLYLSVEKNKETQSTISFTLETEDFTIEFFCFEEKIFNCWVNYLSSYCIKTNFLHEYQILQKLDKGGFATVYLGHSLKGKVKKKVALKLIEKKRIENERNYVIFL